MAKICSRCASQSADDAKFCGSCGTPLSTEPAQAWTQDEVSDRTVIRSAAPVAPVAPAAPPAYTPPPAVAAPPAYVPPPAPPAPPATPATPAAPAPPMVNPFSGVPITDYLRDAGALAFLLAAFFKPWYANVDDSTATPYHHPWWVIIAILVSMVSVAVPYVVKSRAIVGLTRDTGAVLKLAMSAPLLVAAAAEVIMDLTHGRSISHLIGAGVAVAVLGAVLALIPRQADEEPTHSDDQRWWVITKAVAIAAVLTGVATSLAFLVIGLASSDTSGYKFSSFNDDGLVPLIEGLTRVGALVAIPTIALLGRRIAGARVLGAVAVATGAMLVLTTVDGQFWSGPAVHGFDSWRVNGGLVLVLSAAGALALSRVVSRVTTSGTDLTDWTATAKLALLVAVAAGASMTVVNIADMVVTHQHPGQTIAATVLYALAGAGAGVTLALLNNARPNRLVVLAATVGLTILAIVAAAVAHGGSSKEPLLATAFVGLWVLPLLAGGAIAIPKSMSAAYGPLVAPRAPATPAAPVQYQVGDVVNGHRFDGTQWVPIAMPPSSNG